MGIFDETTMNQKIFEFKVDSLINANEIDNSYI